MKKRAVVLITSVLCVCLAGAAPVFAADQEPGTPEVRINGNAMTPELLKEFEALYGMKPVPGNYWYDTSSGLYGVIGHQAAGMMMPGHALGQMQENASNGNTGVFVNGRHITAVEVNYIAMLLQTPAIPGRYWLDAYGNWGVEGFPVPLVNFYEVARAWSGSGGGDNFWSSHFSAGNYDRGNSRGYVSVPGHGPVGYGFD
jgi:hypothetical protein